MSPAQKRAARYLIVTISNVTQYLEVPGDRPRWRGAAIGSSTQPGLGSFYVISHHAFHETGLVAIVTESHMIAWLLRCVGEQMNPQWGLNADSLSSCLLLRRARGSAPFATLLPAG